MKSRLWYAVQENREDSDWGYGSFDKAEAIEMAKRTESEFIAVIDNDECVEELISGEDF